MKPILSPSISVVLMLAFTSFSWAASKNLPGIPDSMNVQILDTTDGSRHVGRVVSVDEEGIRFETDLGTFEIPHTKISAIQEIAASSFVNGQHWFRNNNATRLFFAPTGRMLKKGEGYFSDYYLILPGMAYGLTDHFTIGGGLSIVPGISLNEQVYFITPKMGYSPSDRFHLAAGALLLKLPVDDNKSAGIFYGVGTYGSPDLSFTAGAGFGFVDGNLSDKPMLMVGGEARISRRISLVTENWIFPGVDDPAISYGVRFFGEKLSVDLALINTIGEEAIFPGIPYIDFVFNF